MKKNIFIITAVVFLTAFIVGSGVFVLQKKTSEKARDEAVESTKQEMQEQIDALQEVLSEQIDSLQEQNQEETEEINITDWQIYKNEKYGFEIKYPKDWDINIRESERLFASNGPVGDSFGFLAQEKTINNSPFWVHISVVENVQCEDALAYFDFAHRGDVVVYDGYEVVKLGANQNEFFKITEKSGSYISYIKVKDGNFYEISFFNSKTDDLYNKVDKLIHIFKFDTADSKIEGANMNNSLAIEIEDQNKIYSNKDYGFRIKYPKNWIIFQEDTDDSLFSDSFVIRAAQNTQYNWPFWLHVKLIENADGYVIKEGDPYETAYIGEHNEGFRKLETQKGIYYEKKKDDVLYALFFSKSGIEDLDSQAESIISNFDFIHFKVIRSTPTPVGIAGEDYTIEFLIEGGTPPYNLEYRDIWKKYAFCSAFTQNEDDNLTTAGSGVETEVGSCALDITVKDSAGNNSQFIYTFEIK